MRQTYRFALLHAALGTALVSAGCSDLESPAGLVPADAPQYAVATPAEVREEEREFHELNEQFPGFAGYFHDGEDLVVLIKSARS